MKKRNPQKRDYKMRGEGNIKRSEHEMKWEKSLKQRQWMVTSMSPTMLQILVWPLLLQLILWLLFDTVPVDAWREEVVVVGAGVEEEVLLELDPGDAWGDEVTEATGDEVTEGTGDDFSCCLSPIIIPEKALIEVLLHRKRPIKQGRGRKRNKNMTHKLEARETWDMRHVKKNKDWLLLPSSLLSFLALFSFCQRRSRRRGDHVNRNERNRWNYLTILTVDFAWLFDMSIHAVG